jgi:hypothetical protein
LRGHGKAPWLLRFASAFHRVQHQGKSNPSAVASFYLRFKAFAASCGG